MSRRTPEGKVKEWVREILREMGVYYTMSITGGYGNSGAPDFIVCYKGEFIGIECKAGNNAPTALQLWNLSEIRRCGGRALIINEANVSQLRQELES